MLSQPAVRRHPLAFLLLVPALPWACADRSDPSARATREQLMDPGECQACHEQHYADWAQSMHAYAAKDPVFLAQNRQGQEETGGALGDFCIRCHAPMAVLTGASKDGLNLEELPDALSGVTCYFCHSARAVSGTHNNAIELADDGVLRGGLSDPIPSSFHQSSYAELLDGARPESSTLCGACHDLVTPGPPLGHGVALERTFGEWSESLFSPDRATSDTTALSCSACHMPAQPPAPIAPGGKIRSGRQHLFPAVDVALSPFPTTGQPHIDTAGANERAVAELLDSALRVDVCVQSLPGPSFAIEVTLDNVSAGHSFPSGSTHNRDVWVEVRAFGADDSVLYESGVSHGSSPGTDDDPDLWLLGDTAYDANDTPTHAIWDVARIERRAIPAAITNDVSSPDFYRSHRTQRFPRALDGAIPGQPAKVTVTARLRAVAPAVLDALVSSGHLSADVKDRLPTHSVIPNRHLAEEEGLASLAEVSFEWSPAATESGWFDTWRDATQPFIKHCLGMPSLRGRQ